MEKTAEGTIKRWGGSLAMHISAKEAARLRLRPGMKVRWRLVTDEGSIDLGEPPFVTDRPDASTRHDELLYGDQ